MKTIILARTLLLFIFFSFTATKIAAQLSTDDSIFYQKGFDNIVALYHQSAGDQSGIYNGNQYAGYPFSFREGHPFFNTNLRAQGSIVYDKVFYPDTQLQYDEVSGVIIFQDASHRIQLISERISQFTISGNHFIRIEKDSLNSSSVSTGFYNVLYEGHVTVLKQEVKKINEDVSSSAEGLFRVIESNKHYYIKKDNKYYEVKGKKDLLNIYQDRKKEIKQRIKSNDLSFKNDPDNMLVSVSACYDQLIK